MRRKLLASVVAALISGALVGCGGGDEASPNEAVAEAATKTTDEGSSRIAFNASVKYPRRDAVTVSGDGVVDYKRRWARTTYDFSQIFPIPTKMELISRGLIVYVKFPLITNQLGLNKPWAKLDLRVLEGDLGSSVEQLMQLSQADPSQVLDYLATSGRNGVELGAATVRGEDATHYRATVDLRDAAQKAPAQSREQARAAVERLIRLTGRERLPIDVWVGDDLVRRLAMNFDITLTRLLKMTLRLEIDLFDYGVQANIQPPPANQVADVAKIYGYEEG
jgi:hypothetical protein